MGSVVIASTYLDMQQEILLPYSTEKMCQCVINQSYGMINQSYGVVKPINPESITGDR